MITTRRRPPHRHARARTTLVGCSLLAAVATIVACSGGETHEPPAPHRAPLRTSTPNAPPTQTPAPSAEPSLVRGERSLMSTVYQITVVGPEAPATRAAMDAAFDEIARLEGVLSEWREATELSRVNQAAGGEPVAIGDDVETVVAAGLHHSELSEGRFDLTWAALRGLYLFQRGEERVPTDEEIAARLPLVGYRDVELDREHHTLRLRRAGMALGTGGIAKGYALDRAGAILEAAGFENYMIFGGGQVQTHGLRGDRPWRVGIQHPRANDYIGFLETGSESIATSGDYEHYFIDDEGRRWHHIIDLSTGRPATNSIQVTMIAPRGIDADAYSKSCFILGPDACIAALADLPDAPDAVVIGPDGALRMTEGARRRLRLRVDLTDGRIPMPTTASPRAARTH